MRPLTVLSALYGDARGYKRTGIRRRVAVNERLTPDELARLSDAGFQEHVHRCLARFPFYAERVKAHRGSIPAPGTRVRPEELPVWTRNDQRAFYAQQTRPAEAAYRRSTSGSTSTPVTYYVTRESYEWRTAVMDRVYAWAGAEEGVKSVHVWGADPAYKPGPRHRVKRAVHLVLQRRVFFDAFKEFNDKDRATCCELINRVKPDAIVGYTGMLVDLARFARERHTLSWKARTMVTTAEGLQPGQRELLEEQVAGEVFDSYGCREVMNIGSECEKHTGYHLNTDNLVVEVVDDAGQPVAPGQEGRVVVTDFHNATTPFIRYEVGDVGVMAPPAEPCACGRPFPRMTRVEGRLQDMVYTPRGPVTGIFVGFTIREFKWIEGYQVVQHARDRILIRLLTPHELTPERLAPVTAILRRNLGDITIDYERVGVLSRRASGKFELVISTIDPDA
jgi:phenylacetate-CoA ligase